MTDTDIEALVTWLRAFGKTDWRNVSYDLQKVEDAAAALERQQTRIDELDRALKLTGGVARKALSALDAPPEGDG